MGYHVAAVAAVAQELQAIPAELDAATAQQRLAEHGPNVLVDAKKKTVWQLLLHQLADVMIVVLLVAAGVSGVVGEWKSACVIIAIAIVVLNPVIGFVQEYRADKAMEALQKMATTQAQVVRDGQTVEIAAVDLVPGDVAVLEAGDVTSLLCGCRSRRPWLCKWR